MTRLSDLRKRLTRLKRRRQRFRWTTGYSALATALLWALAAAFPIDWHFQQSLGVGQRLVLCALVAGAVVWAFFRYTLPWLGRKETELDMALMVEHHERIDSDLVAALQFESPEARQWGSSQLEAAVIDQAATAGRKLNVMKSLPRHELVLRLQVLCVTALLWAALAIAIPDYVAVFLNRMLLGSQHYPSRTLIDSVSVRTRVDKATGEDVYEETTAGTSLKLRYNEPLRFRVECSGEIPDGGKALLVGRESGLRAAVPLERAKEGVLWGELPHLTEAVCFQVFVGDAWTDPAELATTQLPVIDVEFQVVRPPYAHGNASAPERIPVGMRQFAALEGSQVLVKVSSDRPLAKAALRLDEHPYELVRSEKANGEGSRDAWSLGPGPSPLDPVVQMVRYSLDVADEDDQKPERPIEGVVRIQADLPPRVTADTKTHAVLPAGKPTIRYSAIDEYAIGRVWLTYEITRGGSQAKDAAADGRRELYEYRGADGPPQASVKDDQWEFGLAPLGLAKGDSVKVIVHAADYRGQRKGKEGASEALVFQVTDEPGIWAGMFEDWRKSARELKGMVQRELGIGETQ
jgi:hypothetical protein